MVALHLPRFVLGELVVTPSAATAIRRAGHNMWEFVARHARGDWGEVSDSDHQANDLAIATGDRILSAYTTNVGELIWIITEADGYSTCILLPAEY